MTDVKASTKGSGRGKYVATPVSVTFPASFPNEKLAGKTVTWKGRGRRPTWYDLAVQAGLIASEEDVADVADTEAPASATDASKA